MSVKIIKWRSHASKEFEFLGSCIGFFFFRIPRLLLCTVKTGCFCLGNFCFHAMKVKNISSAENKIYELYSSVVHAKLRVRSSAYMPPKMRPNNVNKDH